MRADSSAMASPRRSACVVEDWEEDWETDTGVVERRTHHKPLYLNALWAS